jgi:hypothetical protein
VYETAHKTLAVWFNDCLVLTLGLSQLVEVSMSSATFMDALLHKLRWSISGWFEHRKLPELKWTAEVKRDLR